MSMSCMYRVQMRIYAVVGYVCCRERIPNSAVHDWVGVFSPANFNSSTCLYTGGVGWETCLASKDAMPFDLLKKKMFSRLNTMGIRIKKTYEEEWSYIPVGGSLPNTEQKNLAFGATASMYKYANHSNSKYMKTRKAILKFQLINQRADFSFGLFSGGLSNPRLVAVSNSISFANPKAPVYPRLALGRSWDEMTVTWTSGYDIDEGLLLNGVPKEKSKHTLLEKISTNGLGIPQLDPVQFRRGRDTPTGLLREAAVRSPNRGIWAEVELGLGDSLKRMLHVAAFVVSGHFAEFGWDARVALNIYGAFNGKEYIKAQKLSVWSKKFSFKTSPYPGQNSLQRVIIFGDMGKICLMQMDTPHSETNSQLKCKKFRQHGNHERDWPNTGSLFDTPDSGGECGVFAETMYKADYGLFRFCVADSEHDWREGSEQYKFIEHCLATIDRKHQPWLIFSAHRPLDYSSNDWYGKEGSFEEPMGRESLQKLWQKYKVEIPFYGHVHNYERMCPIYQNQCVNQEKHQLLWHCERNNSCGCWWWGKSLVRLHTNTPYLESLQGSLDYGFGKLTGIQSFISLILFAIQRYGGGMLYAALPLHMQRGCFRIRTHDQQVTKAQLYRCTRYSTVEADSLGCLTVVTNMRS
ncbi:putative inactive purple acid phosphatase 27 [Glycine soja]